MKTYYKNKKGKVFLVIGAYMKPVTVSASDIPGGTCFNDCAITHPKIKLLKFLTPKKYPRKKS